MTVTVVVRRVFTEILSQGRYEVAKEIVGGRIREEWTQFSQLLLLRQLGLVAPAKEGSGAPGR